MVLAQWTASSPDVTPLHTIRLGPRSPNRMATSDARMLLDAFGVSIGLTPRDPSSPMVWATLHTVSTLPRLELTTTATDRSTTVRPSSHRPPDRRASKAAHSPSWVARSL